MMGRAIATLRGKVRNLLVKVADRTHDRFCPCGCGFPEDGDTRATRIVVPGSYDQNHEAAWERNTGPSDRGAL